MNWKDYIGFTDIDGRTEFTYHNVYFKKYSLVNDGNTDMVVPDIDIGFVDVDVPTAKSSRNLLIGLVNLYKELPHMSSDEMNAAIVKWCNRNVQPYNIDKLYKMFQESTGGVSSNDILRLAEFPIDSFKKDLISLGTHFNFYYALDIIPLGHTSEAMDLYQKYDGWNEYSCFEKYKKMAVRESNGDEKAASRLFQKYVTENRDELMKILVNKFHPLKISLTIDPETKKPVHQIAIDSVFDIAWFALSKLITDEETYLTLQDHDYCDDFEEEVNQSHPITRCPGCGKFFEKIKNKKYCNDPKCQKMRDAIKSRNYYQRKKQNG